MACNKCGHTKSSPCACKDHGLTTPCSYTDCTRKATTETCEDIQCVECVSYCEDSFCVTNSAQQTFCINSGEKLGLILQKLAMFVATPACYDSNIAYLFKNTVTNNSVELMWQGIPVGTTAINVYYAFTAGPYVLANATPLTGATNTFTVTGLQANTDYKFKVSATTSSGTCDSVELYVSTIV